MSENTGISLLLIEVDQTALEVCRKIIAMNFPDLTIHTASDSDNAIALFNGTKHDIVISDVFIPSKNRIEIAREMCAVKPDTLVLFLTGDPSLNEKTIEPYGKDLCLYHIINKPLDVKELIRAITEAIITITNRQKC